MNDATYKIVELTGSSETGVTEAIEHGIERAAKTLRNLDWFEVTETRGHIQDGRIAQFQVVMRVGFRVED